ncbi:uncharacterized protein LOC113382677 [Ctenocephalides felis]|uniref:uncharacterized protein LOC113382677 n=1 Tax=Ctenocephalides felis TaxID=7515 RepID=UPI000E6E5AE7|nr:uncharacterized protein LOC113382677 [Ctenocephalides felis]
MILTEAPFGGFVHNEEINLDKNGDNGFQVFFHNIKKVFYSFKKKIEVYCNRANQVFRSKLINMIIIFSEAKARILGPTDLYVKTGSAVTLTCVISQGPHDLGTMYWYRGPNIIEETVPHPNDLDTTARVSVTTEWTDGLTSRLVISRAQASDSGNYSCIPTIAAPASVNVHVINGEHPAAMQHGNKSAASPTLALSLSLSLHCALALLCSHFGSSTSTNWR